MSLLKRMLKRPFTTAELHAIATHHMAKPPLPEAMYKAAATMVGRRGVSLLDHWRKSFSMQLDEIANQKTWQGQKAMLLKIVLAEEGWTNIFRCTNEITSTDVWAHLVSENEMFKQFPKETWKSLVLQRYIIGLLSAACLMEVGVKNYSVDSIKQLEVRLYGEYYREILNLDLKIGNIIGNLIDEYSDEHAMNVVALKDDVINPVIDEQHKVLSLMAEQIANSTVDIEVIKGKIAALDARKHEIGEALLATRSSAD